MRNQKLRSARANTCMILRQLQAEGIEADIPDGWDEPEPCPLRVFPGRFPGEVCEFQDIVYYAVPISIVGEARVTLYDFHLRTTWDEQTIELPYLQEKSGRYKFGPLDYAVEEVLNDRLENPLRLHFRGDMLQGVIIAYGLDPIPNQYRTGAMLPAYVTFVDSLERCSIEQGIGLLVSERRLKRHLSRPHSDAELCPEADEREPTIAPPPASSKGQPWTGAPLGTE